MREKTCRTTISKKLYLAFDYSSIYIYRYHQIAIEVISPLVQLHVANRNLYTVMTFPYRSAQEYQQKTEKLNLNVNRTRLYTDFGWHCGKLGTGQKLMEMRLNLVQSLVTGAVTGNKLT